MLYLQVLSDAEAAYPQKQMENNPFNIPHSGSAWAKVPLTGTSLLLAEAHRNASPRRSLTGLQTLSCKGVWEMQLLAPQFQLYSSCEIARGTYVSAGVLLGDLIAASLSSGDFGHFFFFHENQVSGWKSLIRIVHRDSNFHVWLNDAKGK